MDDEGIPYLGMDVHEREAIRTALWEVRATWLPVLEQVLDRLIAERGDIHALAQITSDIRRLRRLLCLGPNLDARRAATRERVRRWRERKRQGIVVRPSPEPEPPG